MNIELKELLAQIDLYKKTADEGGAHTPESLKSLQEYYRLDTTYSSNALEGNTLTLSETKIAIEDGLTVGGKPLRDYYEATGHAEAFDFMYTLAQGKGSVLTEENIKKLHKIFYRKIDPDHAGQYRNVQNYISGSEHLPPHPDEVFNEIKKFMQWARNAEGTCHPVEYAALAHQKLVDIHPFVDGNGRTARLITNLCLLNKGYLPVIIPPIMRLEYISALESGRSGSTDPFTSLIGECELESYRDRLRMLRLPFPK